MSYPRDEAREMITGLNERSAAELDDLFHAGGVPDFADFGGETRGAIPHWEPGTPWWMMAWTGLLFWSPLGRWTGKEFTTPFGKDKKGQGINLFANHFRPRRYKFDTYLKDQARADGEPCLVLDYRPYVSLMFGLVDEVREIQEGVLLGQMYHKLPWRGDYDFRGYFVLIALDS